MDRDQAILMREYLLKVADGLKQEREGVLSLVALLEKIYSIEYVNRYKKGQNNERRTESGS